MLKSLGPETDSQLNDTYNASVNATLTDPLEADTIVVLTDPGEDEPPRRAYNNKVSVAQKEVSSQEQAISLLTSGFENVEEQKSFEGVLAVNTHKSIYLPNEEALIWISVLDEQGLMVCDADVTLRITAPDNSITTLSTSDNTILVSDGCLVHGFTELPDYYAGYVVKGVGNYVMSLTACRQKLGTSLT